MLKMLKKIKKQNTYSRKNQTGDQRGVAIFIAIITVSALLLIALAISNISYREQLISSSARDSRIAFYAADSGLECAMFYDLKGGPDGAFKFSTYLTPPSADEISCGSDLAGGPIPLSVETNDDYNHVHTTIFHFDVSSAPKSCAIVKVEKTFDINNGDISTAISSFGYNNSCDASAPNDSPRVVFGFRNLERSLNANY